METSDRRRRVAVTLLLVNVSLIVLAALWRHAAAQDPELPQANPVNPSAAVDPQPELPSPEVADLPPLSAAPSVTAESNPASDPVLQELREVVRDPNSGLNIPRLDESSPLATRGGAAPSLESSVRLEQRMKTVHALSTAGLALMREARSLADSGRQAEAAAMLQHAAELREMIAELAKREGSP